MQRDDMRQLRWSMLLIGIGVMAAVDEIIFHQILSWHHFYDRSTTEVALLTDGLLHAAELIAIIAGFFLYIDVRDKGMSAPTFAWGWFLVGAGGFQVFDGIVDHKILRLHQIRYGVDILPYDIVWNAAGVLLILAGIMVLSRARANSHGQVISSRGS